MRLWVVLVTGVVLWLPSFVLHRSGQRLHARPCASDADPKGSSIRSANQDPDNAELQKILPIFRTTDGTSVRGKKWVRILTGPSDWNVELEGWLLEETPESIRLLEAHGDITVIRKPRLGEKRPERRDNSIPFFGDMPARELAVWSLQPADFVNSCKQLLNESIRSRAPDPGAWRGEAAGHAVAACRYACWAEQVGEASLVPQLLGRARRAQALCIEFSPQTPRDLYLLVANELALQNRGQVAFRANQGAPIAKILDTWKTIAKIPYHNYHQEAERMVRDYATLIAEERAWIEPDQKTLSRMSAEERAAHWLFHLRDADAAHYKGPGIRGSGWCSVLSDLYWSAPLPAPGRDREGMTAEAQQSATKQKKPAIELHKLGMAAIPQLIAHLDDPRLTRCLGYYQGPYLLRYGDCCQQIFESITGYYTLYPKEAGRSGYPIKDGKGAECKARAERWWQDYQKKGEKQLLIEATERGDSDSVEQARRLAAKYPDVALPPIVKAIHKTDEAWDRAYLIQAAYPLKDDGAIACFRDELKCPYRLARVAAAKGLLLRGNAEGLSGLIREWNQLPWEQSDRLGDEWELEDLIQALAQSGQVDGIQALAAGFGRTPVYTRSRIIAWLEMTEKKDLRDRPLAAPVREAIDDLLVRALADKEEVDSVRRGPIDREAVDPTVSDLAADALARRWHELQLFDIGGSLQARERQRVEVKNVWLQRHGRLPVPVLVRKVDPAPDAMVQALLEAALAANTPAKRREALKTLEEMGHPVLPAVQKFLTKVGADNPANADLQRLAERLSLSVAEVRIAKNSIKPTADIQKKIELLRNKPLDRHALMDVLYSGMKSLPLNARGIKVQLEREGTDNGILLIVSFLGTAKPRTGPVAEWGIYDRVLLGNKSVNTKLRLLADLGKVLDMTIGPFASNFESYWNMLVVFGEFSENVKTTFDSQPDKYFYVEIECVERT